MDNREPISKINRLKKIKKNMCVAQFREYCNTCIYKYDNYSGDLDNPDLQVVKGTHHYNGRNWYQVFDLKAMKKLADAGNVYAQKHLKSIYQ